MIKIVNRLFMLIANMSAVFIMQTAHAEQALAPATAPYQIITQLPDIDREALIEQVKTLLSQLIQRKQSLIQIVADKKLDSKDAIIATIMPGGLLYTGYKRSRYEQAKSELARVSTDIEEISGDLLAMQSMSAPEVVARLD